uniref:F5/8 type C domain-containing protein n=1 Tax=Branchiostoma floridae TaxID=7739 RepID=C3YU44_BRAFL|eukprot:XP_002600309.1 hypothetical protein BRAFLDRAFT_66811 [Branchiostoma floridae]
MDPPPNEVNPNPMYLQSTTEPNASPGPASNSNNSDGIPYTQPSADTRQQGDEVTFIPANNNSNQRLQSFAASQQQDGDGPAASDSTNNDVMIKLSGSDPNTPDRVSDERQHVPNAVNPNPMYVPNVRHAAACGCCSSVPTPPGVSNSSQRTGVWLERDPSWVVNSTGTPWVFNGVTYDAAKALDGDTGTYWNPQDTGRNYNNWYIVLDLTAPHTITRVAVNNYGDTDHDTAAFTLQKSQGGSPYNWEDVVSVNTVQGGTDERQEFGGFQGTAQYWRFLITETHLGWQPFLTELDFYGDNHLQWNATVATVFTSGPTGYYSSVPTPQAVSNSSESYPQLRTTVASSLTGCRSSFPTPPAVSNSSQLKENDDKKLETITFGGFGVEPGKFHRIHGVAVSADNEIFVADASAKRVQVFSITGTYLRQIPTEVPGTGGGRMNPYTVAMDVEPHYLWVAGIIQWFTHQSINVVQYHKTGRPLKTFGFRRKSDHFPSAEIAMDVRNNKVILGEGDKIMMFQPNGSLVRSFRVNTNRLPDPIHGVTSDCDGNVVLADWLGRIMVYNHLGNKILEFSGASGTYKGTNTYARGISVDPFGRIIVASNRDNRVDMFTSRGKFVRTVVNMTKPSNSVMGPDLSDTTIGPDGQLVVANSGGGTVTIFPSRVLFP